jgi:hypothetical protein
MWLEGLGQLKNPLTPSGIEPVSDHLSSSVVPQPTVLPHVSDFTVVLSYSVFIFMFNVFYLLLLEE